MKAYGGMDVLIHVFFTSALVRGEWSASQPSRFTPGERVPGTYWTGSWVGPRTAWRGEISCPYRNSNSSRNLLYYILIETASKAENAQDTIRSLTTKCSGCTLQNCRLEKLIED
jgi:hypothetical protein